MNQEGMSVVQGTVISTNPLSIQIVNDEKLFISEAITYVPKHLTNYSVSASMNDGSTTSSVSLTINNALSSGDSVHILSFNGGKQYYILDRV